jgi:Na+/proline symporter
MNPILPFSTGLLILFGFSIVWIFLGWYWGRNNKSISDFQLAGKNIGFALAVGTSMATWVTTNTTLVAPELTYKFGILGMLGYAMGGIGLILFAPIAGRVRDLLPNGTTAGDFFRIRYGDRVMRIFLLISLFYGLAWLTSLGMAGGILLETLSGIPYHLGLSLMLGICISYTILGGMRAVIGTDFLQTILILLGLSILAWIGYSEVSSESIAESVSHTNPELLNLFFPVALLFLFNNILFGIGEIFHSNVWWSRAFAFRKGIGKKSFLFAGILWFPVPISAGFLALIALSKSLSVPSPDMVGPLVAANLLGKYGGILFFVLVFSALASSLDSLLAATGDLLTEDVYRRHWNQTASDETLQKVSRNSILILGLITWIFCLPRVASLAEVLNLSGSLVASTICPILYGIYNPNTNRTGVFWSFILGSGIGLLGYFFIGFYVSAILGFTVSFLTCTIWSLISPENFSWDQAKEENQ